MSAIVIMGVCGTGKTTIGEGIARHLDCPFLEGDGFHPKENVEKMRAGIPLDDDDRWPWLEKLGRAIGDGASQDQNIVAACSALKRAYRDRLRLFAGMDILFIMLDGDPAQIEKRMAARTDHYMPPTLLQSQLAILERPDEDETSISIDIDDTPDHLIGNAIVAMTAALS
jgi:gluconokinase